MKTCIRLEYRLVPQHGGGSTELNWKTCSIMKSFTAVDVSIAQRTFQIFNGQRDGRLDQPVCEIQVGKQLYRQKAPCRWWPCIALHLRSAHLLNRRSRLGSQSCFAISIVLLVFLFYTPQSHHIKEKTNSKTNKNATKTEHFWRKKNARMKMNLNKLKSKQNQPLFLKKSIKILNCWLPAVCGPAWSPGQARGVNHISSVCLVACCLLRYRSCHTCTYARTRMGTFACFMVTQADIS